MILLSFEVFITQSIALELDSLIISLFLKFLYMVKILLTNSHEVLELKR